MGWLAFILALLGCIANAKKSLWCWALWLGANACWLCVAVPGRQWPLAAQELCFIVVNVFGYYSWRKNDTN